MDKRIKATPWTDQAAKSMCNTPVKEIQKHPERLEGEIWFLNICRIHRHLFGMNFLMESRCAGCPGNNNGCSATFKESGYLFTDNCPDVWYDMPCFNLNGATRALYLIPVNRDGKTYKAFSLREARDFIIRHALGWKGPFNEEIQTYCDEAEHLLRKTWAFENVNYRDLCILNSVKFRMLEQVGYENQSVEEQVKRLHRNWLKTVKKNHLDEYQHVSTVKGNCPAPAFIKKMRKPKLFGKACPMRPDGITGDAFCLECKFNEQAEDFKDTVADVKGKEERDRWTKYIFGWHGRKYVKCNFDPVKLREQAAEETFQLVKKDVEDIYNEAINHKQEETPRKNFSGIITINIPETKQQIDQ